MRVRASLGLLLACALLASWQSALLHPLVHLRPDGSFVHLAGAGETHSPASKNSSNVSCDALAALTACVAGPGDALAGTPQSSFPVPPAPVAATRGAPPPAYRSQAPPSLL